jgi:hypothetical protein
VLDHLLVDLIGTIRSSFDRALLQRQAVEERFQVDVFLGDLSWETSYSLPGEEQPPRVRARPRTAVGRSASHPTSCPRS